MFRNSYLHTLDHTTMPLFDGTTYVVTGDIPLMWLRDSSAQVQTAAVNKKYIIN